MTTLFFVGKKVLCNLTIYLAIVFCFFSQACTVNSKHIKVRGNTNYTQSQNKSLSTNLNLDYTIPMYETKNKKYLFYIGGTITTDFDHFGNEIKTNTFTTFGVDF
jgi:hypothetical protein